VWALSPGPSYVLVVEYHILRSVNPIHNNQRDIK
jgi:hypothetical protein